jgi:hypothetical protein
VQLERVGELKTFSDLIGTQTPRPSSLYCIPYVGNFVEENLRVFCEVFLDDFIFPDS